MTASYEGELHCTARHGPSSAELSTDAPTDNQGKGQSFSPTDLVATALTTCMLTTLGIAARAREISLDGAHAAVDKHMGSTPRRHIAKLEVSLHLPASVPLQHREVLETIARTCPVAESLAVATVVQLTVAYDA